ERGEAVAAALPRSMSGRPDGEGPPASGPGAPVGSRLLQWALKCSSPRLKAAPVSSRLLLTATRFSWRSDGHCMFSHRIPLLSLLPKLPPPQELKPQVVPPCFIENHS